MTASPLPLAEANLVQQVLLLVVGLLLVGLTAFVMKLLERAKRGGVEKELEAAKAAARAEAQKILAQAEAQAKGELIKRREEFDHQTEATRKELREEEKRLSKRADMVDQKLETLNSKERLLETGEKALVEREKSLAQKDRQLNDLIAQQRNQLLKVANLSMAEARDSVLEQVEKDM